MSGSTLSGGSCWRSGSSGRNGWTPASFRFPGSDATHPRSDWRVGSIPADLLDRLVEITGPTNAKMVINALNSGARLFMADFEDATAPVWDELVQGQINLRNRWLGRLDYTIPIPASITRLASTPPC